VIIGYVLLSVGIYVFFTVCFYVRLKFFSGMMFVIYKNINISFKNSNS